MSASSGNGNTPNTLIVGANKGLGSTLVHLFQENGHNVYAGVLGNDYDPSFNDSDAITVLPMNVTDEAELAAAADYFDRNGIALDNVINVAGVLLPEDETKNLLEIKRNTLETSLQVNAIGNVLLAQQLLPTLKPHGNFFLITSEAGSVTNNGSGYPAYSVSKAAANKIAYILDATSGDQYKFLAIHPGRMNTDMGKANAQIEPIEAALGIYALATGKPHADSLFIDYNGNEMEK